MSDDEPEAAATTEEDLDWLDDPAVEQALGAAWHDDTPNRVLTELTALGNRMAGSPGERHSAEILRDAFDETGVTDASIEPFDLTAWHRGTTTLSLSSPVERDMEAVALPYSPSEAIEAPLVDIGYGTPEEIDERDVEGAIVLASTDTPPRKGRFVHRQESYGYAVDAGAVGFVFANHVEGQLPPTGALRSGRLGEIPGVGVSYETGEWLRRYAEEDARVALDVEATTESGEGHNVVGTLGPGTEDEVLVVAHHDAHDIAEGGLDNGCGVATLLAATRVLAKQSASLDRQIRVVATSGEEIGLLGAEALADSLDVDRVHAVVNIDGAGRFRDLRTFAHCSDAVADVAETVADAVDHPITVLDRAHPHSDHWPFLRAGVPVLQLHSHSGERGRGFTHTRADTRDKADDRAIREHGMLGALLIRTLAQRSIPRLDDDRLQSAFQDEGLEAGMKAMGDWPNGWD